MISLCEIFTFCSRNLVGKTKSSLALVYNMLILQQKINFTTKKYTFLKIDTTPPLAEAK
jgi:hypothetical protein